MPEASTIKIFENPAVSLDDKQNQIQTLRSLIEGMINFSTRKLCDPKIVKIY